jgi:hypothetical protein
MNMKKILVLIFTVLSFSAFSQVYELNNIVRNNTLSPARVANALDAFKPYTATGTDTYAISPGMSIYAGGNTYTSGDIWTVTFTNENTGAATLNVNADGAIAIVDNEGNALAAGDLVAGGTYILRYNGTHFRVVGATGSGGSSGGGASSLPNQKTETGTTYTVLVTDSLYVIHFSNASGCTVTMPNTLPDDFTFTAIRDDNAGKVTFTDDGTSVLDAVGSIGIDTVSILYEGGVAGWIKDGATKFNGYGQLGLSVTVADAITNGVTNQPPSQNAVYDALSMSTVSSTEIGYLDGVTSAIQTQLGTKEATANKATDFSTINDTKFPTVEAVVEKLSSRATKTTDYATVQTDNQKLIVLDAAITKTITVDQLTADSYISFVNIDVGQWNLEEGTGVTLYGSTSYLPGGEVNSLTLWWLTATDVYVISGFSTSLNSLSVNGALTVRAGLSAGVIAKVGGTINSSITTAGNVGAGEDDLFLYEVPANTLNDDKSSLIAYASGTFAANANNKRIKVKFGGTNIFDTGALALNAGDWTVHVQIYRTASATQKAVVTINTSNSTLYTTTDYSTAAVDLTTPLELKVTAEATSNNDIVGEVFKVVYQPAE